MLVRAAWALAAAAIIFPAAAMTPQPAAAAPSCTGWTSTTRPPETIRVLRLDGVVDMVDFRRYVGVVMASGEWPSRLPRSLLAAGAVAVKQFAWYHSLAGNHRSSFVTADGKCYDVLSTTRDQLYKPGGASVSSRQWNAIDATWSLSARKNGRFILTPYRAGSATACGSDAVGKRIYQRSARDCARKGYSARQILRTYYGPDVSFKGAGGGSDGAQATSELRSTPKASPKPKVSPKPKPKPRQQARRDRRPVATPTAEPEVEIVPWWEIAMGTLPEEEIEPGPPDQQAAGQLGQTDTMVAPLPGYPITSDPLDVRVSTWGSATDEFRPLVARNRPAGATDGDAASASASVSFLGRSFSLSAAPGPAGEVVSVYVDGELAAMIDMYWQRPYDEVVVYEREWDEETPHTVKLLLLGQAEQLRLDLEANLVHY